MPKLNDTQTILLSSASQRDDLNLYPTPRTLTGVVRVRNAIAALIDRGLAEERETRAGEVAARIDGDLGYGVFATAAGLAAIGVELDAAEDVAPPPTSPVSKTATVVSLLRRDTGATMPELIAVTGWLPHTTRAALTGLRKKGHAIERSKRDDATCYRIAVAG